MLRRAFTAPLLAACFGALLVLCPSPASAQSTQQYRVTRGDSLTSVARKFGLSIPTLAAANDLSTRAELRIGQTLTIPGAGAATTGQYRVVRGDSLTSVARKFGLSIPALAAANDLSTRAELRIGQTLTIPGAGAATTAAAPRTATAAVTQTTRQYRVVRGDSLTSVAREFGLSIPALAAANEMSADEELRIGETLTIPGAGAATTAAAPRTATAAATQTTRQYRVVRGDSLTSVAGKFGLSLPALAAANNLSTRAELRIGETLTIPGAGAATTAAAPPTASATPERYTVRRGDTLTAIARRFGVSIDSLRAWNNLTGSTLLAGVRLVVSGEPVPATARTARRTTRVSTYADSTAGDITTFDDPVVRAAAVAALGRYNGSVVAIDPNSGRILTIVNQKLAFSDGFIPCSTIKPVIAVAALEESVIRRDTMIKVGTRSYMNLVEALARSNNFFFEELGRRMGFDTVAKYARLLGLGELAGYNLPEEQPGAVPSEAPRNGGVARMSSFGEGIQMTPLQLASLISTLANGGTMYYLQYPRTAEEQANFEPRIKRRLDIESLLPDVRAGMLASVLYGTSRRSYSGEGEQPLGKTGTCSDPASRLGWFVSYADQENPKIVLAILMRGRTRTINGPFAAQIAGKIYQQLYEQNYFTERAAPAAPGASGSGN